MAEDTDHHRVCGRQQNGDGDPRRGRRLQLSRSARHDQTYTTARLLRLYQSEKGIWHYEIERDGIVKWSSLGTRDERVARRKYESLKSAFMEYARVQRDDPNTTEEPILQIVVEVIQKSDGTLGWGWDAFGDNRRLCGETAPSLSAVLDSMRRYLRDEGLAP